MASKIRLRRDTLDNWGSVVPDNHEPVLVLDNTTGDLMAVAIGKGTSTVPTLLSNGHALARLRHPEFVDGATANGNLFGGIGAGKGMRVGTSTARFTNQSLFVDGRMSNQIRSFRLRRTSNMAFSGTAGTMHPVPMEAISTSPVNFGDSEVMQDLAWFDGASGGFRPTIPGWWLVTVQLSIQNTTAIQFPAAAAVILRKTGAAPDEAIAYGCSTMAPENASSQSCLGVNVTDIVFLQANDLLRAGVFVQSTLGNPWIMAGGIIGVVHHPTPASWMSGFYLGHHLISQSPP